MSFQKLTTAWEKILETKQSYQIGLDTPVGEFQVTPVQITVDGRIIAEIDLDRIPEQARSDEVFIKYLAVAEGHANRVRLVALVDESGDVEFKIVSIQEKES